MEARPIYRVPEAQPLDQQVRKQNNDSKKESTKSTSDFEPPEISIPQVSALTEAATATGKGGGALRSIDQKFQVNPNNGTLSFSVPLQFTNSRGKFHPELSLSYNSGSGNGSFGVGWDASTESVSRKTSKRIPSYGGNDVFTITGADDLVPVEPTNGEMTTHDGYSIQRYRPRVEHESMRIERWTSQTQTDDVYWRSINAANVTKIYGRTDDSRVFDMTPSGSRRIFTWLICESYDASGNAIVFGYKAENRQRVGDLDPKLQACEMNRDPRACTRARYLKWIRYGNRDPCRDLTSWSILPQTTQQRWMFEVVFDYGEHDLKAPTTTETNAWLARNDPFSTYRSGFEIRQYRLCRRILMFHHFPGELGPNDYLVSSTNISYEEWATGSLITSLVRKGHFLDEEQQPQCESLAPCTFEYNLPVDRATLKMQQKRPSSLTLLRDSGPTSASRWIDLDGEGSPGLLTQLGKSWYYQRNLSMLNSEIDEGEDFVPEVDDFASAKLLGIVPSVSQAGTYSFQDLDGSGLHALVTFDPKGRLGGYYDCCSHDNWMAFQNFRSSLQLDIRGKEVRNIDLTGDGMGDIMLPSQEIGGLVWHECLGKTGYGGENRAQMPDTFPRLSSETTTQAVYLADMSGDGLTDMVQITNRCISYWPNLGYGRFGGEIIMGNSPCLDSNGMFDVSRVHLLDMDGSGTADLVYLLPNGGLMAYLNSCGNVWSDGELVTCFPLVHNPSNVFTLDLLGKGTSCLCWVAPDGGSAKDLAVYYLDFSPGPKPYMLRSFSNGTGLTSSIKYSPSTKFYLRDERAGRAWITKLPFPVHTVREVVERDRVGLTTYTTKYQYHDGYYDGQEREFRGFGMVEKWETEQFVLGPGKPYRKPTRLTKMWFHTGAPGWRWPIAHIFGKSKLKPVLPDHLVPSEEHDVYRALKGTSIRSEIYGQDGTSQADLPYVVDESNYEVVRVQRFIEGRTLGVYKVQQREKLTFHYERHVGDPRVEHEVVLERNSYGDKVRVVSLRYGRKIASTPTRMSQEAQGAHHVTLAEYEYTNAVWTNDEFYKPSVARQKQYRLFGLQVTDLASLDNLRSENLAEIPVWSPVVGEDEIEQNKSLPQERCKVLMKETRVYFRDKNLNNRLPLGVFDVFSVVDQSYQLDSTRSRRENIFGVDGQSPSSYTHKSEPQNGGYVDLDGDGNWWTPSSCSRYAKLQDNHMELSTARESFYIPTVLIDPFGNVSGVEMDAYWLLPIKSVDAIGNESTCMNNYRLSQAVLVTDENMNRTQLSLDSFGDVVAFARMGKVEEKLGDDVSEVQAVTIDDIRSFMMNPTPAPAKAWLGKAGRRWIHCKENLSIPEVSQSPLPLFKIELAKADHALTAEATEASSENDVLVTITYVNGRGKPIQEVRSSEWKGNKAQWCHLVCSTLDVQGTALRTSQPFFSNEHIYVQPSQLTSPATISVKDALDRVVGVLHPDHTWSKSCWDSWSSQAWDVGNTVLVPDVRLDPDVGNYFSALDAESLLPTWLEHRRNLGTQFEQEAAAKSERYANNPKKTYNDCLGRPILVMDSEGPKTRHTSVQYDIFGNKAVEVDTLDRVVEKSRYSLTGQKLSSENMDAGRRLLFRDCTGAELLVQQVESGWSQRVVYDELRRPTETWVCSNAQRSEVLWSKIVYAESEPDSIAMNLKGRAGRVYDQSGVRSNVRYDFKGNCVSSTKQFTSEYKEIVDWTLDVKLEEGVHATSTAFDAFDRPNLSIDPLGRATRRQYNLLGGLTAIAFSAKTSDSSITERLNHADAGTEWMTHISKITYTADGRPERVDYGNTAHTEYKYDSQTRHVLNKKTWRDDGKVLEDFAYVYDCMSRITHVKNSAHQDIYFRNQKVEPVKVFTYDAFGRIVRATGREMVDALSGGSRSLGSPVSSMTQLAQLNANMLPADGSQLVEYTESYLYDSANNILQLRHEFSDPSIAGSTRKYYYEEPSLIDSSKTGNRLSRIEVASVIERYGYDDDSGGKAGCISSMPGYSKLEWDCNQRLRSSAKQIVDKGTPETTWYVYDSEGKRVRKVTERQYNKTDEQNPGQQRKMKDTMYLDSAEIFRTYSGDSNQPVPKNEKSTSYLMAKPSSTDAAPIVILEKDVLDGTDDSGPNDSALLRYCLSHGLEVDDHARVVSYEEYTPFGNSTLIICGKGIEAPSRYRFASYTRDAETGLYLCGARYYACWLGRWISPDPKGTIDGPNMYAYVANDPVNRLDTEGTCGTKVGETESPGDTDKQKEQSVSQLLNSSISNRAVFIGHQFKHRFDTWTKTPRGKLMILTLNIAGNIAVPGLSLVIGASQMAMEAYEFVKDIKGLDDFKDSVKERFKGEMKEQLVDYIKNAALNTATQVLGADLSSILAAGEAIKATAEEGGKFLRDLARMREQDGGGNDALNHYVDSFNNVMNYVTEEADKIERKFNEAVEQPISALVDAADDAVSEVVSEKVAAIGQSSNGMKLDFMAKVRKFIHEHVVRPLDRQLKQ